LALRYRLVNIAILFVLQYYWQYFFLSIASILAILFQKSIANGIANTFVPKILPVLFGNTFILLDAMIIVKHFNNVIYQQ